MKGASQRAHCVGREQVNDDRRYGGDGNRNENETSETTRHEESVKKAT